MAIACQAVNGVSIWFPFSLKCENSRYVLCTINVVYLKYLNINNEYKNIYQLEYKGTPHLTCF